MGRLLELTVDRKDVGRIDNSKLSSSDDTAPGFVVILQVIVLQILAPCLGRQEVVFHQRDPVSVSFFFDMVHFCNRSNNSQYRGGMTVAAFIFFGKT